MAISMLRAMTKPGGFLITKETLSRGDQQVVEDAASGYTAIYRNNQDYLDSFVQQGFRPLEKIVMRVDEKAGRENAFFVFRLG
jgi:hypothetical protein